MKSIIGNQWIGALVSGANAMNNNRERIDKMNVFPVPDGDTGSNMEATIAYAAQEIQKLATDSIVSEISSKFSRGMLLGARGNSGVILSQIFKGFSIAFKDKTELTNFDVVEGFAKAKEYAYKSVMKPVEGTILTVVRMIHEKLSESITPSHTIEEVFAKAKQFAREACDITPTMLPILKEVGVTDSGGEGLYVIIEGIYSYFQGKPVEKALIKQPGGNVVGDFLVNGNEDFTGEYGYCTEFIVTLNNPKAFKKERFEPGLEKLGDSIIVVADEEILKVHMHTLYPGKALNYTQRYGEFMKIKSENMSLQVGESMSSKASVDTPSKPTKEVKNKEIKIGVISCNIGAGIVSEMKEMGVDFVIESGQSSNPSAQDFIKAINSLKTNKIILLPNNSNIVLTAHQVTSISDKEVIVIPTKTQMAGISAIMNFDRDMPLHENQENMTEAISAIKTGQVTKAIKSTKIHGVSVKEGEYLAIADREILSSFKSKIDAAVKICEKSIDEDTELVSIYFGDDASQEDAEEIAAYIKLKFSAEIEIKEGKQPMYHFLMAFE